MGIDNRDYVRTATSSGVDPDTFNWYAYNKTFEEEASPAPRPSPIRHSDPLDAVKPIPLTKVCGWALRCLAWTVVATLLMTLLILKSGW